MIHAGLGLFPVQNALPLLKTASLAHKLKKDSVLPFFIAQSVKDPSRSVHRDQRTVEFTTECK